VQGLTPSGPRHVVHAIASLVNATDIRQTEQGLEQQRLIDPLPEESALPALREHVLADPALVDHVVSADGRMATIVLRTDFMSEADAAVVYDALQRILRESETDTFTLRLTGMAALEVALNRTMERDVTVVVSICLVAMLAILFFIFRGPFGVLGPLLVVLQAVVWTLGAMALAGAPMTGVTSVLASFLICVGMADSIHVQSVFRDLRRDGANARDAVVQALAVTGVPVLMTSLTTIAGLLSFRTASLSAVIDMGTYGAFGVAAALVLSLVFLPAFLTFHRGQWAGRPRGGPPSGRRASRAGHAGPHPRALRRHLSPGGGGWPAPLRAPQPDAVRVVCSSPWRRCSASCASRGGTTRSAGCQPDHQARTSLEAVDRAMGGTATVHMLISAPLGQTLKHHDVMSRLERLEAHALAYEAPGREGQRVVTNVTSVLDVLRQGPARARAGAVTRRGCRAASRASWTSSRWPSPRREEPLRQLITLDAQHAVMSLRVRWLEAGEYAPLEEHLTAGIREHIGTAAHVELTGSVYANFEVVSALIDNLAKSFLSAFVVIALLMIVMLGDFKLGLLAMLPNVLPVMVVGGVPWACWACPST
jgi:predicted RND superfamily exporter protein